MSWHMTFILKTNAHTLRLTHTHTYASKELEKQRANNANVFSIMRQEKCAKMQTFAGKKKVVVERGRGRGQGDPGQGYGLSSRLTLYV